MRLLADTSVIVNSLRRIRTRASVLFDRRMAEGNLPAITPEIYREVLQGTRSEEHFAATREQLIRMTIIGARDVFNSQTAAAWLYAQLRWKGITLRSSVDCLIAQIAIENDLSVIYDDGDYEKIAKIEPRLKLA